MIFPKFRLPDRTLGLLSRPDQEKLATLLQHQHYCELLQRTICTALSTLKLYSSPTSTHLPILLSTLVSVHPEHLCSHLWKFLAAFASTSSDCATLTSAIVSSLDSTSSEKVGRRCRCPLRIPTTIPRCSYPLSAQSSVLSSSMHYLEAT